MKKRSIKIILFVLSLLGVVGLLIGTSYIAPLDDAGQPILATDAVSGENYLDLHWDEMMTEINSNAVELSALLNQSQGDLASLTEKFCTGDGNNFTVYGTAKVLQANTDSQAGYLVIEPDGASAGYTFRLQVGPVFKGTSIRDSLTCISFSDFPNQMQWSELSSEIMQRITQEVLSQWDMSSMEGKNISYLGCFTFGSSTTITITPIQFSAQ